MIAHACAIKIGTCLECLGLKGAIDLNRAQFCFVIVYAVCIEHTPQLSVFAVHYFSFSSPILISASLQSKDARLLGREALNVTSTYVEFELLCEILWANIEFFNV